MSKGLREKISAFLERTGHKAARVAWKNKWIRVELIDIETGDGSFEYTSVIDGIGHGVMILPYRTGSDGELEFLVRREATPAWNYSLGNPMGTLIMSGITGGIELGESPLDAAVREMEEETGYVIESDRFESQGHFRSSKVMQNRLHMYLLDLNDEPDPENDGEGDGSYSEQIAKTVWSKSVDESPHVQLHFLVERVRNLSR